MKLLSNINIILFTALLGIITIIYSLLKDESGISSFNSNQNKITVIDLRHTNDINYALFIGLILIILSFTIFLAKYYSEKNTNHNTIISLTSKEQEVLSFIEKGFSNKEIANELFISLSTVKTHINTIFKKMKVTKRKELFKNKTYQ
ncbi:MAG: LuxR C-terminal-related transcriptional regulator [Flavobacteriaceae bacterium]|nr:LuxR C-terminal-related transcriptional regulator [Flavobacteriaceae bacterium]